MRRRRLNLWDSSGASALEFALVAPALFLTIAGAAQVGWTLHCAATVRWSLETSARNLLFNPSESADTLKQAMVAKLAGKASAQDLTVTITPGNVNGQAMLIATSVFRTTVSMPFVHDQALTFTSVAKVPSS